MTTQEKLNFGTLIYPTLLLHHVLAVSSQNNRFGKIEQKTVKTGVVIQTNEVILLFLMSIAPGARHRPVSAPFVFNPAYLTSFFSYLYNKTLPTLATCSWLLMVK